MTTLSLPSALRSPLARNLLVMSAVCSGIAALLAVLFGDLINKMFYSFGIGMSCWAANTVLFALVERLRALAAGHTNPLPPMALPVRAALGFLGVLIGASFGLALSDMLTGRSSARLWDWNDRGAQITLTVTLLAASVASVVMAAQSRMARIQAQADAARREAAEMQLRLLQSQLEPHMLFNTLANLRVLIGLEPAHAQAMLDRLIGFLRSTLAASRVEQHALRDEFARIADYLALMGMRMGPRLQSSLSLPPELADLPVPPLLLQPLVENAIKHGLEPQVAGGRVAVRAERHGATLTLTVRDTGAGLREPGAGPAPGTGFGLQQVRQRLQTLHGPAAHLQLQSADDAEGGTVAHIQLPLPE